VQDLPADTPNKLAMAPDQGGKGRFISIGDKTLEELGIIQFMNARNTNQVADVLDDTTKLRLRHLLLPAWKVLSLYNISVKPSPARSGFF
jgi:hypothetical protein